jgi:predicted MPP superfamily phosphohydrolase
MKIFCDMLDTLWPAISTMPVVVPVFLLPFVAVVVSRTWQSLDPVQKARPGILGGWWVIATTFAFAGFDLALLAALPRLGLSFGPVGLPLLGITGVRMLLTLGLLWGWRRMGKFRPCLLSSRGTFAAIMTMWLLHSSVLALEIKGMYLEPFEVQVTELNLSGPAFLPDRPLRLVHLTDLHIERITKREQEIIKLVNELEPDLIVLTGDYLNTSYTYDPIAQREARSFLAQLHAPHGVYAVMAKPVDPPEVMTALFEGLDIVVLDDKAQSLSFSGGDLYLVGVTYAEWMETERDEAALSSLMAQVPPDAYSILLYHTPDIVAAAAKENVNLHLAGHTHGGQVRLPLYGAVLTASAFGKKYEQGRYTVGPTTLYVSRGLGMEGQGAPRVRFLCQPEVVLINLAYGGTPLRLREEF